MQRLNYHLKMKTQNLQLYSKIDSVADDFYFTVSSYGFIGEVLQVLAD